MSLLSTSTHTHPLNGPLSKTTRVSQYQKSKTNLDFTEARDNEWQWHQLGHMQVCISLQTDNHATTPPLSFLQAGCPSCRPTNSVKALKALCCRLAAGKWHQQQHTNCGLTAFCFIHRPSPFNQLSAGQQRCWWYGGRRRWWRSAGRDISSECSDCSSVQHQPAVHSREVPRTQTARVGRRQHLASISAVGQWSK